MAHQLNKEVDLLPHAKRERIAHIDFTLFFKGEAVRADLTNRFSIAPAQATKDFILYRDLAPGNIEYDEKAKVHKRTRNFTPLFQYDAERTLATITQGFGDGFVGIERSDLPCEAPYRLNQPRVEVVAAITEAIYKNKPVSISYHSLSNGASRRVIVPHTVVDNGTRWHVRAFDRETKEFRDFVLTRISSISVLDEAIDLKETKRTDREWNTTVDLQLIAHPGLPHKETIELDYGMQNGELNISLREANAGYLLRLWNVDCSNDHSLIGGEYHLALKNRDALNNIASLAIAPQRRVQD